MDQNAIDAKKTQMLLSCFRAFKFDRSHDAIGGLKPWPVTQVSEEKMLRNNRADW